MVVDPLDLQGHMAPLVLQVFQDMDPLKVLLDLQGHLAPLHLQMDQMDFLKQVMVGVLSILIYLPAYLH